MGRTGGVRIRGLLKAVSAAGLVLALTAACGGASAPGADAGLPTLRFGSTAPPATAAADTGGCDTDSSSRAPNAASVNGKDVARIRNRGYLVVGVAADQYLTGFLAPDGQEEGFDIDLAYAIGQSLFGADYTSSKVRFVAISTDERIPDLQKGKVDLVIDTMTITCARLKVVDFSAVYYKASQRLLVESGSGVHQLSDLGGKSVCAQAGSTSIAEIQHAPVKPAPIAIQVTDISDCLVLLQQNQVSAISTDDTILAGLANQDPSLEVVGSPLEPEPYGIAMPLGETDMEQYVNGVLAQYVASGGWQKSYSHWLKPSLGAAQAPVAQYSD
jgi:polar amino acid transport system substrate-binding protein